MKKILITFIVFGLISSSVGAQALKLINVHVDKIGQDKHQDVNLCKDFSLTDEQAALFFSKVKIISSEETHFYMWFPCWVQGRAELDKKPISWKIRAGGTAVIESDGQLIHVADESQLDIEE
jgi:hypothetical protein